MTAHLEAFVERISYTAELLFERDGRLSPIFFAVVGDHIYVVPVPPLDRNRVVDLLKLVGVARFAFVDEAWTVTGHLGEDPETVDPSTDPRRTESVLIVAHDVDGHRVVGARAIIREQGERARLGELELAANVAGGSMNYMLADKTTRH